MKILSLSLILISTVIATNDELKTKSSPRSYIPYHQQEEYQQPNYYHETETHYQNPQSFNYRVTNTVSRCADNTTLTYCLTDRQYPLYEVTTAYQKYREQVKELTDGSFTVNTEKSVDLLSQLSQEKYLCPSTLQYARPLRAIDINGRWRIILNVEGFFQTVRLETCTSPGTACPNIASCFSSNCLQKYVFQRLVVFNEVYDHYYNPFTVATFKLPSSCCCRFG